MAEKIICKKLFITNLYRARARTRTRARIQFFNHDVYNLSANTENESNVNFYSLWARTDEKGFLFGKFNSSFSRSTTKGVWLRTCLKSLKFVISRGNCKILAQSIFERFCQDLSCDPNSHTLKSRVFGSNGKDW